MKKGKKNSDYYYLSNRKMIEVVFSSRVSLLAFNNELPAGGLTNAFNLAAFRLSLIAPGKKSVNHSRTVASMRETRWEQQQ